MKREIEWTAKSGQQIKLTVEADYELNTQGQRRTHGYQTVVTTATIDGLTHSTVGGLQSIKNHPTCVAKIGKLGLTQDQHDDLVAARNEIADSIAEYNADIDRHANMLDDLSQGTRDIELAMRCGE